MNLIVSLIILAACAIIFAYAIFLKRKALATSLAPTRTQRPPPCCNQPLRLQAPLLPKKWSKYVPWKTTLILLVIALFFFQYPQDIILSWIRNPHNQFDHRYRDISRSVIVRTFDDFDVCDLEIRSSIYLWSDHVTPQQMIRKTTTNSSPGEIKGMER